MKMMLVMINSLMISLVMIKLKKYKLYKSNYNEVTDNENYL